MKTKPLIVLCSAASLLALILALWGTWSFGYHRGFVRGYDQGGRDEFLRWKQEPTRVDSSWDGFITGRRNMREKASYSVLRSRSWPVNSWSAPFSATGALANTNALASPPAPPPPTALFTRMFLVQNAQNLKQLKGLDPKQPLQQLLSDYPKRKRTNHGRFEVQVDDCTRAIALHTEPLTSIVDSRLANRPPYVPVRHGLIGRWLCLEDLAPVDANLRAHGSQATPPAPTPRRWALLLPFLGGVLILLVLTLGRRMWCSEAQNFAIDSNTEVAEQPKENEQKAMRDDRNE
jgi:hypothetical protein